MLLFFFSSFHPLTYLFFFFFNDTATTEIYTLSLHDALPILLGTDVGGFPWTELNQAKEFEYYVQYGMTPMRSEEHTSELQSRLHLVCRLLLEKKKIKTYSIVYQCENKKEQEDTDSTDT